MPRLAPPKSFKYENHIEVLRHLDFFGSWGGQSGTLTFFCWSLSGPSIAGRGQCGGEDVQLRPELVHRLYLSYNVVLSDKLLRQLLISMILDLAQCCIYGFDVVESLSGSKKALVPSTSDFSRVLEC